MRVPRIIALSILAAAFAGAAQQPQDEAASRGMDVPAYAAALLERAAQPEAPASRDQAGPKRQHAAGRKSLAQLVAESPFRGLDLDFERDRDFGRDIEL